MNLCYKVVQHELVWNEVTGPASKFFSAIIDKGIYRIEYKVGEWINSNFPTMGILVYRNLQSAQKFRDYCKIRSQYLDKHQIFLVFSAEYDEEIKIHPFGYVPSLLEGKYIISIPIGPKVNNFPYDSFSVNSLKLLGEM